MPDHGDLHHPEQTREIRGGVRQSVAHESAVRHVSGTAKYIDDLLACLRKSGPGDVLDLAPTKELRNGTEETNA